MYARSNRALVGKVTWSGSVRNKRTGATLPLDHINHPPEVPVGTAPGAVVKFTPKFASATPSGPGVEVILDAQGRVTETSSTRGTKLTQDQTSLQAAGREAAALLRVAAGGCLTETSTLTGEDDRELPAGDTLFAVTGRHRLLADGQIAVPPGTGGLFGSNPRAIVGTTEDKKIVLATIDGRMSTSVGTTLKESAAVAKALGMHDVINLDGGGSATMSLKGRLINKPCDSRERAVGDALIFVDSPYRPR
ncbi:phosphodiester glycosidase family protein [Nonomuraea sp. KM88]|uniref:phosphodiester glycosidase family protein n=1 Tax=Nonomuraea sp. KM88 TaxID=3457427 RepID=UPI003FCE2876